jgi:hypothetical protein
MTEPAWQVRGPEFQERAVPLGPATKPEVAVRNVIGDDRLSDLRD